MTVIDFLKRLFGLRNATETPGAETDAGPTDTPGAATVTPPDTSGKPTVVGVPSESRTDSEAVDSQGDTPT